MRKSIRFGRMAVALAAFVAVACDSGDDTGSETTLAGIVLNERQESVADVVITIGTLEAITDIDGRFTVADVPTGTQELTAVGDWYEPTIQSLEIGAGENQVEVAIVSLALEVTPADLAVYNQWAQTFDWTVDTVSVAYARRPTRAEIEKALYYHNPALLADPSGEAIVIPSEPPAVGSGGVTGLDFVVLDANSGAQVPVFDIETAVDDLSDTPLSAEEIENGLLWEPAVELYLVKWNLDEALLLNLAGQAVEAERWGGASVLPPQALEHLFVHGNELWVEIAFENFVTVGEGITDSDGDGYVEVFVRLAVELYSEAVPTELATHYAGLEYDTLGLVDNLAVILDDLYTRTNPAVVSTLGVPYEAPSGLSFEYPFAVLEHSSGAINVLLVEP